MTVDFSVICVDKNCDLFIHPAKIRILSGRFNVPLTYECGEEGTQFSIDFIGENLPVGHQSYFTPELPLYPNMLFLYD